MEPAASRGGPPPNGDCGRNAGVAALEPPGIRRGLQGGRGDPRSLNRTRGALDPTGAICGPYGEGVGTGVCVGRWLL